MEYIMARDQYGDCEHGLDARHPRADLLKRLGSKQAGKVYVDRGGEAKHIGYVIGKRWFTFYRVTAWEGAESNG